MSALLLLLGCSSLEAVDGEAPCREVGYAIARRTYDCTGDPDLANARYEAFEDATTCVPVTWDLADAENEYLVAPEDQPGNQFHCSFAIGELACELVLAYEDDLALWLTASPACDQVVEVTP